MDFAETEVTEVRFYGMINHSHIAGERNNINTEHLFLYIAKSNENRKEKKKLKKSTYTRSRWSFTRAVDMVSATVLCQY